MKIDCVELRRIALPLVRPFRTSFGTQTERDVLLARVTAGSVEGWGECVAGAVPDYSSEFTAAAQLVSERHLIPRLLEVDDVTAHTVASLLSGIDGHRMAKAALELAVLDAELRIAGTSLADHLGGTRTAVEVGVSIGITDDLDSLVAVVRGHVDEGYQRVKLKIEPGFDVEPVARVRREFGDDLAIQVDANTAYALEDTGIFRALDDSALLLIEQPFAEDDLLDHAELARRIETPICLDEGITTRRVARQAVELGACSIVNIKAGRVGGHLTGRAIHDDCVAAGVPVWCGGMLETGIGRAANLALAALPGFTLPGDISATDRYWQRDVCDPFVLGPDSTIDVPSGPGLGVEVDLDFVESITTSVDRFEPT